MDIEIKTWLYDISNSIKEIDSFVATKSANISMYKSGLMFKRAIERNLETTGEATHRMVNADSLIELTNARRIVDLRNKFTFGQERVTLQK